MRITGYFPGFCHRIQHGLIILRNFNRKREAPTHNALMKKKINCS